MVSASLGTLSHAPSAGQWAAAAGASAETAAESEADIRAVYAEEFESTHMAEKCARF
jgi:hypothetical protein